MNSPEFSLAQYRWKNRIILIFSPSAADLRLSRQLASFEQHAAEVSERDIVVLQVIAAKEMRMRNLFRVGPAEFAVLLIGKDGNEKHRWSDVAPMDQINHRIDRMPMRRVEMKGK